jgi:hypothetical protein
MTLFLSCKHVTSRRLSLSVPELLFREAPYSGGRVQPRAVAPEKFTHSSTAELMCRSALQKRHGSL